MAGTNRRAPARGKRSAPRGSTASSSRSSAPKRRFFDYPRTGFHGLHRWLPSWRVVVGTILGVGFLGAGAVVGAYAYTTIPDPADDTRAQTTTVYYANLDGTQGEVMGTFAAQKRKLVEYADLPPYIGQAVAAAEDKTFFTNNSGVSVTGMGRALLNNLRGGATQGGSTLTQQYVERYYVDKTTTDYVGKFKETLLAIKIARTETKPEIMGRYLNTIYFGRDSYGIQAASQAYFAKDAKDLTQAEAALLAGIIPSPNNWDPRVSPAKAEARWNIVLDSMEEEGWLTSADRAAMTFPATVEYVRDDSMKGPTGFLLEMVRKEMAAPPLELTDDEINRGGFTVQTTIQKPIQDSAVAAANGFLDGTLPEQDGAVPNPAIRVSISSVNPADGAIVALYGGRDYITDQRNAVTYDRVQAGSTFKPFTLLAALQSGVPLTERFSGRSPQTLDGWDSTSKKVSNFGNSSFGTIDLVEATAQSVNTVYAQLNLQIGPEKTVEAAEAAGITTVVEPNPGNVLGSTSVRPIEMATAYATIASGGVHNDAFIVRSVTNPSGTVAYERPDSATQAFSPEVAADTTFAMAKVVEDGSGKDWIKPLDRPIAGKTGTSTDNKSAWFVGFTPNIVTEVSLSQTGADGKAQDTITPFGTTKSGRTLTEVTGSTWPAFVWQSYMQAVFANPPYAEVLQFPERANVGATPRATTSPTPSETPTVDPEPTEEAPTEVAVPGGLEGKLEADASASLYAVGLTPTVVSESSETVTVGRVIRIDPQGGATVAPGSAVTLVISTGPKPQPQPTPTQTQPPEPEPEPTEAAPPAAP